MKRIRILYLFVLCSFYIFSAQYVSGESFVLFAEQDINSLTLVATDPDHKTFVLQDPAGNQQKGNVGDFVGYQREVVAEVKDIVIVVVTKEDVDRYGFERTLTHSIIIPLASALNGGKGIR